MDYLRKFRSSIRNELGKYTRGELELTKNMAVVMFEEEAKDSFDFPNRKAISDITLLVNHHILEKVEENVLSLNEEETISISKEQLYRFIKEVREEYQEFFSKKYQEMRQDAFIHEVMEYLKEYDFIREKELGYTIYPSVSKLVGYIPKDKEKQLDLFGGKENESI